MVEFGKPNMPGNNEFPDIYIQKSQFLKTLEDPMCDGETWYIIDQKWMKRFKYFVGIENPERSYKCANPGPIDNILLIDDVTGKMVIDLIQNLDYVIIPASTWTLLYKWYGMKEDQEPISRKVINVGRPPNVDLRLEVYKIELTLFNNLEFKDPVVHEFSQIDLIFKVEEVCRQKFNIPDHVQIELRCFYGPKQSTVLLSSNTIYEERLDSILKIVMVILDSADSTSKCFIKPNNLDASRIPAVAAATNKPAAGVITRQGAAIGNPYSAEGYRSSGTPGLSGLINLGNTCFLNSILQCLSKCEPLTQYFLNGNHEKEINVLNPLGKSGLLASAYADIISLMWCGKRNNIVTHYFKIQLTKFAPQFAGCQQHDAQELFTFLLNGLHEDLNRIRNKPYYQCMEDDQEDDAMHTEDHLQALAQEAWKYFLRRDDSIIVDHFQGMLKSQVVCPDCEKVSITFDLFKDLSLPLPLRCDKKILVHFVPYNQSQRVMDLTIVVPKKGNVQNILTELSKITLIKTDFMVLVEIVKCHFHRIFALEDSIESIGDRDKIYMYNLPEEAVEDPKSNSILPVVLWEVYDYPRNTHFLSNLFGTPFLMLLPRGQLYFKELYDKICERLTRSCNGFRKANQNYGCFSMEYESGDSATVASTSYLFTPVLVSTYSYENIIKIHNDEHDVFVVPDHFGQYVMALQVSPEVRLKFYKDPQPIFQDHTDSLRPSPRLSLNDCLSLFTTTEKLGETDTWYCPRCHDMKRATKKFDLWKLPNILVFHLKRFIFNETTKEKLETKVDFPLTDLNISNYVVSRDKENYVYDLFGVCNHYGGLLGGHYVANCKNFIDGKWYCFDDNSVHQISSENIQTENAYVLFYQRRTNIEPNPDEDQVNM